MRLADLSGEEQLAARLLDAIMRTAAGPTAAPPAPASGTQQQQQQQQQPHGGAPEAGGAAPFTGSIRRHPVWCPSPIRTTKGDDVPAGAAAGDATAVAAAAAGDAAAGRSEGRVHVVGTDQGGGAPQLGALANPIFMTEPGLIQFELQPLGCSTPVVASAGSQPHDPPAIQADPSTGLQAVHQTGPQAGPQAGPSVVHPSEVLSANGGASGSAIKRVAVPFVPGAFVLTGVLSRRETAQIVAVSERMGYALDADYTFAAASSGAASGVPHTVPLPAVFLEETPAASEAAGRRQAELASSTLQDPPAAATSLPEGTPGVLSAARSSAGGERAAGCVWLADNSLLGPVWERVRALLPQRLAGEDLAGINARWRLYRYDQGTGGSDVLLTKARGGSEDNDGRLINWGLWVSCSHVMLPSISDCVPV